VSSVATYPAQMTVEEFEAYPFPDGKVELVRGEPRVNPPAGVPHGIVESNLARLLYLSGVDPKLGRVFTDGLGYELIALPRTVRDPDMSFVRSERLPRPVVAGFCKIVPDLVVEVLSPSEKAWELQEKLEDYAVAGVPLIWVIDEKRRTVRVLTAGNPERTIPSDGTLDGGEVMPGFSCRVAELFEGL
jgi:Uma2 family endonuclease